jgi:hypothetical protein
MHVPVHVPIISVLRYDSTKADAENAGTSTTCLRPIRVRKNIFFGIVYHVYLLIMKLSNFYANMYLIYN